MRFDEEQQLGPVVAGSFAGDTGYMIRHPVILRVKTSHLFAGENQPPLRRFFHNIILSFCKRVETDFYCSWIVFGLDCRYLNGG